MYCHYKFPDVMYWYCHYILGNEMSNVMQYFLKVMFKALTAADSGTDPVLVRELPSSPL